MPYLADRVQETAAAPGTGTVTLAGAVTGYQSFATAYAGLVALWVPYCITDGTNWEVGKGTYTVSGTTLTRDTIYSSSNSGSAVNFSGGVNVFVTAPADSIDDGSFAHELAMNKGWALP